MARVIDLQEQTEITEDAYILTDNATTGTHKFNLKQLYDDSQRAIVSAQSAANSASSAAATAREVAASAQSVASEAESVVDGAAETLDTAAERVDAAIDAVGDISELAVPEMSSAVRGGAKLDADGGLALRDGALGIGTLVQESSGQVRGGIASLTAKGHAEQATTTGKNLLPRMASSESKQGVTATVNADGSITVSGTSTRESYGTFVIVGQVSLVAGTTYTLSGCAGGSSSTYVLYYDGAVKRYVYNAPVTWTQQIDETANVTIKVWYNATVNVTFYPQLELGSTATEYETYSGGLPSPRPDWEQPIKVVRGRNLLGAPSVSSTTNGVTRSFDSDTGTFKASGTPSANNTDISLTLRNRITVEEGESLTFSLDGVAGSSTTGYLIVYMRDTNESYVEYHRLDGDNKSVTFANLGGHTIYQILLRMNQSFGTINIDARLQLELGSTPTPYVPYGHVGMEARDSDTDELISCTALPLPSRGWVGSLPDGTADVLRLDGAGKVEWELGTSEARVQSVSQLPNNNYLRMQVLGFFVPKNSIPLCNAYAYSPNAGSKVITVGGNTSVFIWEDYDDFATLADYQTWLTTNPVTVLYPLATPVIEQCGYVDMPSIAGDATVSIPELDALGVSYFVDDAVVEYGRQIYERVRGEYASRIEQLEQSVAELATA